MSLLFTESLRCLFLCCLAMAVGDCVVRAVTLVAEMLDERPGRVH